MYIVDLYLRVRKACLVDGMSVREASRVFGVHRDTVNKMLSNPVPPGYRRKRPPRHPKLEAYMGVIDRILEDAPVSQYGAGSERAEDAAPHGQAHLRATESRARVQRRLHHSQGLRSGTPAAYSRDVRAAGTPTGRRPVRLRPGVGDHRGREAQGPLLRSVASTQRRRLREGIPGRDDRGIL